MATYKASQSDIARAVEMSPSAVSLWLRGKKTPRDDSLAKLAEAYPKFTVQRLTAAAGRRAPAPLTPDRREAVLDIFDRLTQEQQELLLIQAKAVADSNQG
ncbi:helix-turn-helix domain-containing protein [Streptomyces sp. LBUM 1479]|nr:helix-turn-helix domain-containing protein [Streptomyces sp. LBUM 1479]